jgi:predicted neutral ceramidase superfamily lipid hydrolase
MDNGKISTYVISGAMIIFAAILADPSLVEPLMGPYYTKFLALIPLLIVVFNAYYPRTTTETKEESA